MPWHRQPLSQAAVFGAAELFLYIAMSLNLPLWATCLILLVMWALAAVVAIRSPWTVDCPLIIKGLFCVLAAGFVWMLGAKTVHQQYAQEYPPSVATGPPGGPTATATARYYPLPLTMRNLFDTDFKPMHITQDVNVHHVSPAPDVTFTLTYQLILDFDARTEYIAVYIPRNVDTVLASKSVAQGYQNVIDQLNQRVKAWTRIPGETADTATSDLTFSGRIYIYYENDMPLQQMAALEQFFNDRKLAVEFRGPTFLTLHWNEKREMPGNSVSLPIGNKK
jgi:hypothetical protein